MYRFIVFNCMFFCLFVIACMLISCTAFTCIHDEVTDFKNPSTYTRSTKFQDIRSERARSDAFFEPLNVHFYMDELDKSISENAVHNIEMVLKELRTYFIEVFKVRKRKRPFLLDRQGCTQSWQAGINRGKCSKFKSEKEFCSTSGVVYPIPERYLDKLEVFDFDATQPRYSVPQGTGLLESNFIVFITGQTTSACEGTDVLAYGTYCRDDPRTNEPLAGILNLCPNYFSKKLYGVNHYRDVMLHELFHILGFSFHQFERYLPCEKGVYCDIPKNIVVEDSNGTGRLVFPLVVESMRIHFNCEDRSIDFGAPLAVLEEGENSTGNMFSSHWHPLLMYSSIMTPKFSDGDHIFIDNITLATFASTGWYKVNFEHNMRYSFGKDGGCAFGSTCDGKLLCDPSKNGTGCDFVHDTVGKCTEVVSYHPCGIYQPHSIETCGRQQEKQFGVDYRSLSYSQQCFIYTDSENETKPLCLPVRCTSDESIYQVFVDEEWKTCSVKENSSAPTHEISCPNDFDFCDSHPPTTPAGSFCTEASHFYIAVRMNFGQPSFIDLSTYHIFKNFKVTALRGIASRMDIPVEYIVNASLNVFKTISMDFAICPSAARKENEVKKVVQNVQTFLDGGSFLHVLNAPKEMLISSTDIKINPNYAISFSDHEGFRTLLILPFMFAVFLIATLIASLVRLFLIQKHRPRRTEKTTEEDDAELSDVKTPS